MHITTPDGVRLYAEEAGRGTPILFIHEFGGNHASWEPQLRHFSRRHRCITYAARGYPPSDVPGDVTQYSQAIAVADALAVLAEFLAQVEAGAWLPRDARALPGEVMRTG